jgi:hypothetical protein
MLKWRDDREEEIRKSSVGYPYKYTFYCADNILLARMNPCPVRGQDEGCREEGGEG